jgi:hypothetical protein
MKKVIILFTSIIITPVIITSCSKTASTSIVEVTAKDYYFQMQDSIPSGWITFRFINNGHATHFFSLTLLPESVSFQNYLSDIAPAFSAAWDTLQAGATKGVAGSVLGGLLPKWYASAKYMGGAGLTEMGKTSETTIKLIPGNYVMECYIKTPDGKFHGELGMIRPLTVTDEVSKSIEPVEADIEINLSNLKLEVNGNITSGMHKVAVHFNEQPAFGLGNDVHLVRLNDNTNLNKVIEWMDWMNINGLRSPAPAEFLGGTQEMPAGNTSYFYIELTPGRYAWISEINADKGMVKEFRID